MFNVTLIAADWWSWLIPLVFIIIYLVNHMLTGAKPGAGRPRDPQQQQRRGPAGERPLRPGQAQVGGQSRQQPGQTQLNAEIEQFLKRANQRRMEKSRREAPPARPTPKPPLAAPPPPLREQPLEIEPLEQHDFDEVDQSVKQHLGNRGFEQRAEHLADDVVRVDEEMEQHLKKVFDHKLGTLKHEVSDDPNAPHDIKAPITRADPQASAKALAGILANQQDIRQAVLLKEILERPVDRW